MSYARMVGAAVTPALVKYVKDPIKGWQTARYWTGTLAEINFTISTATSQQRIEKTQRGDGLWDLVIYSPDNDGTSDQQDTWELINNRTEKDLFEHPRSKAIAEAQIRLIKDWLRKPNATSYPALTDTDAQNLYKLELKGTTKFTTFEYALRYSISVTYGAAVTASFADLQSIFTTAQLGTPATSGITIPTDIGFSIASIPAKTEATGQRWGWLKIGPSVRKQGGKTVISAEWWLDLWEDYVYTFKS